MVGLSFEVTHSSPRGWGALVDIVAANRRAREDVIFLEDIDCR